MVQDIEHIKKNIIAIGRLLWEKDLASGLNGNISVRLGEDKLLMTAHGTCLGILKEADILEVDCDGAVVGQGDVSTEKLMHTEVYKNNESVNAIIHTHTPFVNGYFLENNSFCSEIFESKIFLGTVNGIEQNTPSVTDASFVIDQLKKNNVVVLKNHGVLAVGVELFDSFLLIQSLEESIKTQVVKNVCRLGNASQACESAGVCEEIVEENIQEDLSNKKYPLFSQQQVDEIVKIVNQDLEMQQLGEKTQMVMDLAVKLDETGKTFSFSFLNGKIVKVGDDENAEFLINAPESVWRAVFKRELDPFVATTQRKMHLRGDFAKISKFYAPCSRIFELWAQVPVE